VDSRDLITIDPEILGGTPVFKGTRVPVKIASYDQKLWMKARQ
jgi:uncharacterized protein (DUF433 family)